MIFDFEKIAGGFREVGGQNRRRLMRRLLSTELVNIRRLNIPVPVHISSPGPSHLVRQPAVQPRNNRARSQGNSDTHQ